MEHLAEFGAREQQLYREAGEDQCQQRHHEGLQRPLATSDQHQHQQRVAHAEQRAPGQRQAEQQLQGDGGADHLGQVAGDDRRLAGQPQQAAGARRVAFAAGLGQVQAAGDAQARGQRLQQHRHQAGEQDHREQQVAQLRAAGDVGGPVARVHVAHRDQVAGAGEGQQAAPPVAATGDFDRLCVTGLGGLGGRGILRGHDEALPDACRRCARLSRRAVARGLGERFRGQEGGSRSG